jgi:hypothetical protein
VLSELTGRELAMLRAVAAGSGELLCAGEPDLAIDGYRCDFLSAHHLTDAGLVRPVALARAGAQVPPRARYCGFEWR